MRSTIALITNIGRRNYRVEVSRRIGLAVRFRMERFSWIGIELVCSERVSYVDLWFEGCRPELVHVRDGGLRLIESIIKNVSGPNRQQIGLVGGFSIAGSVPRFHVFLFG